MINEMTSLTYSKLELLICLHFPMAATGINKEGCHFNVSSGPFKWPGGVLISIFLNFFEVQEDFFRVPHSHIKAVDKLY